MTTQTPLISVVVPFYNVRECVGYCMKSLLSQTFEEPYEVLCVDDGSTDGTGELLEEYASDPRVVVLHKENGGLSDARNYGVERAQAELVTFVDGDDFVALNYLEALFDACNQTNAQVVMCDFQEVPIAEVEKFLRRASLPQGVPRTPLSQGQILRGSVFVSLAFSAVRTLCTCERTAL